MPANMFPTLIFFFLTSRRGLVEPDTEAGSLLYPSACMVYVNRSASLLRFKSLFTRSFLGSSWELVESRTDLPQSLSFRVFQEFFLNLFRASEIPSEDNSHQKVYIPPISLLYLVPSLETLSS